MDIKEKILSESEKLFMQFGLRGVSMDEVAAQLGMSKKTIYNYITDKKDLVYQVIQNHFDKQTTGCQRILIEQTNPIMQMLLIGQQVSSNYKSLNPMLIHDLRKYYPKSWELFLSFRSKIMYNQVLTNLKTGIETGYYRSDMNPEIVASLYLNLTETMIQSDISNPGKSYIQLIREMIWYHLHGVCSQKGIEFLNHNREFLDKLDN